VGLPGTGGAGLATDGTWLKNIWQLSRHLDVDIKLDEQFFNLPVCQNDQSMIGGLYPNGFAGSELKALKVFAITSVSFI